MVIVMMAIMVVMIVVLVVDADDSDDDDGDSGDANYDDGDGGCAAVAEDNNVDDKGHGDDDGFLCCREKTLTISDCYQIALPVGLTSQ